MRYALLIYSDTAREEYDALPEETRRSITAEYMAIADMPGTYGGAQLEEPDTATTLRAAGSDVLTTDGPYAETKEMLGGFYLIEAENLDAALAVARRIPAVRLGGAVEVRPLVERGS